VKGLKLFIFLIRKRSSVVSLNNKNNMLDQLDTNLKTLGYAGSTDIAKLVYLTFITSNFEKPVSLVIKGPSGSGKSYALNSAKNFIPEDRYEEFSGMSEKAIVYLDGIDLKHKHLIIGEAAGMADGNGRTLIRQLISEGKLTYATVQSTSEGLKGQKLPEIEGPCGLIMTTTATGLHLEDESRMLSVTITESEENILAALLAQAENQASNDSQVDFSEWHNHFQLITRGNPKVVVPYASLIARKLPLFSDKIKRVFPQVLSLIRAHALVHRFVREAGPNGEIIAIPEDYAAVYQLVNKAISEGLGASVSKPIAELVKAVETLAPREDLPFGTPSKEVSITALAEELK
jgi:energy-coupling factor transporter ATP-binding protein EcfA2